MYLRKVSSTTARLQMRALSTKSAEEAMIKQVSDQQKERAARVVPWFMSNMPVSIPYLYLRSDFLF